MPTTLPSPARVIEGPWPDSERSSNLRVSIETAVALMLPPAMIVFVAAACIGHGEISPRTIGAVFQASANHSLCLEYACADPVR